MLKQKSSLMKAKKKSTLKELGETQDKITSADEKCRLTSDVPLEELELSIRSFNC